MQIEFRDLKKQYLRLKSQIDNAVLNVLSETSYISGPQVKQLETRLAEYVGVKHCISCANGTDALSLVLMSWGIGPGDAVFVPNFTFFASAEVISFEGATPVFVDVDRQTFNISTKKLEESILEVIKEGRLRPRAILAVDLFGLPANYSEIIQLAKTYKLLVLEDAAQGFGGSIDGKKACSFGDASTTSFFPAKPLGCYGDGGAIFTNDDDLASLIRSLKVHGKGRDKYDNVRIGINSRLDTLQAAILNEKFDAFVNYELDAVNDVYLIYNDNLAGLVEVPSIPKGFYSSFAQYTIKLRNQHERNQLSIFLRNEGIPTMVYYPKTMHEQLAFEGIKLYSSLSTSSELVQVSLSLPIHPYLESDEVLFICNSIHSFFRTYID